MQELILEDLLRLAVERKASDLHITVGRPPVLRINGRLKPVEEWPMLKPPDTDALLRQAAKAEQQKKLEEIGEVDFSFSIIGLSRFRVNAFKQRGSIALVFRMVNEHIPELGELGFPDIVEQLAMLPRGLVLVTGPTGSGKSTTLAAMIKHVNRSKDTHIITLEDPIEYMHRHDKSIVNQREISADTQSFTNALRAALREDPDIILVGEMRDAETIATAITAAETGHLVLATLHTGSAAQTIDRIVDVFPPHQQQQIRVQLAVTLQGIISQQLLPQVSGGRIAALEILVATPAVRNLIREGKTHQLATVIQTGAKHGMKAMDMALKDLYRQRKIEYEEALQHSFDPEAFLRLING